MPINYLEQRKASEQGVGDIVSGRNVEDELSRMKRNVGELRTRFLDRTGALVSKTSGMDGRGIASRIPELDAKTQAILARKKMELQRGKIQAIANNAYEKALQYGMDEQSAREYARQIVAQQTEQSSTSDEYAKDRAYKTRLNALAEQFGISRLNLEDQFAPKSDYGAAVLGGILGMGTQGLISYMNREKPKTTRESATVTPPKDYNETGNPSGYSKTTEQKAR